MAAAISKYRVTVEELRFNVREYVAPPELVFKTVNVFFANSTFLRAHEPAIDAIVDAWKKRFPTYCSQVEYTITVRNIYVTIKNNISQVTTFAQLKTKLRKFEKSVNVLGAELQASLGGPADCRLNKEKMLVINDVVPPKYVCCVDAQKSFHTINTYAIIGSLSNVGRQSINVVINGENGQLAFCPPSGQQVLSDLELLLLVERLQLQAHSLLEKTLGAKDLPTPPAKV